MPSPSSASRPHEGGADGSASSPSSARAAAEIIAITSRDDFLLEIGEALSGSASVRPVDSVATALEQIAGSRKVHLLAVDARDVDNLRGDIERINSQAPHIVTLVFANADAEKQTAFALKGTNVFAVLPIPLDKRKTAAVLEGAVADATARAARPPRGRAGALRFDNAIPRSPWSPRRRTARARWLAGDSDSGEQEADGDDRRRRGCAVVVAAAAFWYFMRSTPSAPGAPPAADGEEGQRLDYGRRGQHVGQDVVAEPAPVVDMPLVNGTVDELLEKARRAMRERRYTEPNGDNALLYYRSAAKADTTNGEAGDGLKRVAGGAERALRRVAGGWPVRRSRPGTRAPEGGDAGRSARHRPRWEARDRADHARCSPTAISTAPPSLVKGAQQSGAVSDAQITKWRNEINRRQDEARQKRLVDLAQDRIQRRAASRMPTTARRPIRAVEGARSVSGRAAARVQRDLGDAFMRKAREAALGNAGPDVDRWLAEAKSMGVSSGELNSFQRDLELGRRRGSRPPKPSAWPASRRIA